MSLLDKIKAVFTGPQENPLSQDFDQVIQRSWKELTDAGAHFYAINLSASPVWTEEVKRWPDKKKVEFVLWLVPLIERLAAVFQRAHSYQEASYQQELVCQEYLRALFRSKLLMDDEDAARIFSAFSKHKVAEWASLIHWPLSMFVNQLEKQRRGVPISAALRELLQTIKTALGRMNGYSESKDRLKLQARLDEMLNGTAAPDGEEPPASFPGDDPFAAMANRELARLPEAEQRYWYRLLRLAQKASGAKPSAKYLGESKIIIDGIGAEAFKKRIQDWFGFLVHLKEREERATYRYDNSNAYDLLKIEYLDPLNAELLKGLIWTCSNFHDSATIQSLSALAERAFRKIPGVGAASTLLGNACLFALYKTKGLEGIGQLSRLKQRVRQASTQTLIDRYLKAAAADQGVTTDEIEDMAVDDCGLQDGSRSYTFDDYRAELMIVGVGKTAVRWHKPDGGTQQSAPAQVKERHAAGLKKLKDQGRKVELTLSAQRDRMDRLFRSGRRMPLEAFRKYYFDHGLTGWLTKRLIWNFHYTDGRGCPVIWLDEGWQAADGTVCDDAGVNAVSLWHPVQSTVAGIRAWRSLLQIRQLQQPLKQAYREVYFLTDAESQTKSYSNRMAAHILRQHQFNSLAKARGWHYLLAGSFDNGSDGKAHLFLPEYELRAEYWLNEVNTDGAMGASGIWTYISTDQVRFVRTTDQETVDLADVPPLVFSEVMRDVDLFVGVASVGNDPSWADSGGQQVYRDYWQHYSFGDLSELAKNRKEILEGLVPRLKIREVASIRDKFLVVKGKLRTYKIHIGSTNILMEPNDQYLCIVPDRGQKHPAVDLYLPFEGDTGLSIILSKAILLAADDKITDATITSQINRK